MTEATTDCTGTYNLFLGVLVRGQQVDCLDLSEVNIVAKQEDEQELANIFLLLVTIQKPSLKYSQLSRTQFLMFSL